MTSPFGAIEIKEVGDPGEETHEVTKTGEPIEVVEKEAEEKPADTDATEEDVKEEAEEEAARTIALKFYGEDEKFDPFADEEETAKLLQMGKDYEKKAGVKSLVDSGALIYDTKEGGLKVSDQFVNEQQLTGANTVLGQFEKAGLIEKDIAGNWQLVQKAEAVQNSQPDPDDSRLEALGAKMTEGNLTPGEWQEFSKLTSQQSVKAALVERDRARTATDQKRTTQEQQQKAVKDYFTQADTGLDKLATTLKPNFIGADGKVDEKAWKGALDRAKLIARSHDGTQYRAQEAAAALKDEAESRKAIAEALSKAKPRKAKTTSAGGRSSPGAKDATKKNEVAFDPKRPFGHIANRFGD